MEESFADVSEFELLRSKAVSARPDVGRSASPWMTVQKWRFSGELRIMPPKSGGAIRLPEGGRIVATWEIQAIYVDGDHPMRLRLMPLTASASARTPECTPLFMADCSRR